MDRRETVALSQPQAGGTARAAAGASDALGAARCPGGVGMDGGTSHARAEALNNAFGEHSGAGRGRGRGRSFLSARGRGRANGRGGGRSSKTWTTSDGLIAKGPGQVRTQARPNGFLERRQRLWVGALEQRAAAGLGGLVVTAEPERVSARARYSVAFLQAASEEWRKDPSWLGDPVAFRTRLEQTIGRDSDQRPVRRSEAPAPAPVTDTAEGHDLFWDDDCDGDQPDVAAAEALRAQAGAAKEREAAELLERQRREQSEAEERQQQAARIAQVAERRRQQLVALQQASIAASKWGDLESLAAAIAKAEDDGVDANALSQARRTEAALISRRKKQIEKEEEEARQLAEDTARQLAKQAKDEKRRAQAEAKAAERLRVLTEKEAARQAEEAAAREAQEAKWAAEEQKRAADEAARKRLADTLRSEAAQARRDLQEQEESLRKQQEEERQARKREREAAAAAAAKANVWGSVQSNAASAGTLSAFPALGSDALRHEPQSTAGEDDGLWWDSLEDSPPQKPAAQTAAEVAANAAMTERQAMLAAAKKKTEAAEAKWRRMEEERVAFEEAEEARVRAAVAAQKQKLEEKRARDLEEMRRLQTERAEAKAKSAALWGAKYQAIVAEDSGRGGGTAAASAAATATAPFDAAFPSLREPGGALPDFGPAPAGTGRGRGRGRGRAAVAASLTLAPAPTQQATSVDEDDDSDDAFEDAVQDEQSWQQRINAEKQAAVERSKAEQAAKQHAEAMQARQAAEREAALRTAEETRELARQEAEARSRRAKEAFERRQRELAELSAQREEDAAESRSAAASTWANQYEALSRKDMEGSGPVTRPKAAWGRSAAAQPAASEKNDDTFPSLGSEAFPSLGPAPIAGNPRGSNLVAEKFGLEAKRSRAERKKERERLAAAEAVEEAKAAAAKAAADKLAAAAEVERQVARAQAEAEAAVVRMREAEQLQAERARLQAQKTAAVASTWAAKYEAVVAAKDETEFPSLATTDLGSRKTGWGRTGAAAGTGEAAVGDQSAATAGAAAFPTLGEAFPSLPAPAPVALRSYVAGRDSGSAANGGYGVATGRKGRQAKGLSSTQRKKAKKKRIAAGEWTKLEKVRCLCENNGGCTIRARFPEDGRWYDATLDMHVGNQYKVTYTDYDDSGLLTLDDLQIDEAWLSFEYSTRYVAPRIYGESDEDDDEGYDTADDETDVQDLVADNANGERRFAGTSEPVGHHTTDSDSTNDAQSVLVVGKQGARDRAARAKKTGNSRVSSEQQDPKHVSAPVPEPEPKTVYSPTAAAAALNAFLSSIGGQCMLRAALCGLNLQRFRSMATHVC